MDFEAELQLHNEPLLHACAIRSHEHVLDIGCGTGQTTRDAARHAAAGFALGIDITETMIAAARARAASEGLHNLRFEHDDAQVHGFSPQFFELAMSRYGTMFFADPVAAFRNIRSALRPDGRLVMMVWQAHELNEWSIAVHRALAAHSSPPIAHDHFSLSDPAAVEHILGTAGFAGVEFVSVHAPVYYGVDVEAAVEWIQRFRFVRNILHRLDAAEHARMLENLRESLTAYSSDKGVWIGANEWIVMAKRG